MNDLVAEAKAKFHELMTWIEQEIHGKVEEDAKAGVSEVVEAARDQGADLIATLGNDLKNDLNLAQAGVAKVAGDVASAGASASSEPKSSSDTPA